MGTIKKFCTAVYETGLAIFAIIVGGVVSAGVLALWFFGTITGFLLTIVILVVGITLAVAAMVYSSVSDRSSE